MLQNNIPIDPNYYLENQISKVSWKWGLPINLFVYSLFWFVEVKAVVVFQPLLRIFEPVLKNASSELLRGDHTRSISISTPSNSGIMRFAKKQLSCVGCKVPIRYTLWFSGILGSCKFYLILRLQSFLSFSSFVPLVSSLYDCICGIFLSSFCFQLQPALEHCVHVAREEKPSYTAKTCLRVSYKFLFFFLYKLLDPSH